jgi:hypothetical protein
MNCYRVLRRNKQLNGGCYRHDIFMIFKQSLISMMLVTRDWFNYVHMHAPLFEDRVSSSEM